MDRPLTTLALFSGLQWIKQLIHRCVELGNVLAL